MGAGQDVGLTQFDGATGLVRDGADDMNLLGDEIIDFTGSYWCAQEDVTATSLANAVYQTIFLDHLMHDDYGVGMTAQGEFTAPANGTYEAWGLVSFGAYAAAGTKRGVCLSKNSLGYFDLARVEYAIASTAIQILPVPHVILPMTAGDTLGIQGYQDTGATRTTTISAAARSGLFVRRLK